MAMGTVHEIKRQGILKNRERLPLSEWIRPCRVLLVLKGLQPDRDPFHSRFKAIPLELQQKLGYMFRRHSTESVIAVVHLVQVDQNSLRLVLFYLKPLEYYRSAMFMHVRPL